MSEERTDAVQIESSFTQEASEWNTRIVITRDGAEIAWLNGTIGPLSMLEKFHRRRREARDFLEGAKRIAYLSRLRCAHSDRRRGFASRLIEAFCTQSAQRKASICLLDVDAENTRYLIGFYQRRGFVLLAPETRFNTAFMGRRLA